MGFRSDAGAVHERARTDFGPAGQYLYDDTDGAVVVFAVEFALAEAGKSEDELGIDWAITTPPGTGDLPRSHTIYNDTTGTEGEQGGNLLDDEDSQ